MGRQWLQAKREVAHLKKGQATQKLVKEIMVAAKMGGSDAGANARLAAAIEKARKNSVSKDVIERAVKKGAGLGEEKLTMEHVIFEGYAPHKVPVIVEVFTDNNNRTAPEIRVLFKKGQLGSPGSNKFLFDHVGLVEVWQSNNSVDVEAAAIEAGADDFALLDSEENDDIPPNTMGVRFITSRTATGSVAGWLREHGWNVVLCELGFLPRQFPDLSEEQRREVGEFLQALDDHDDVHRVWAAVR